MAKRKTIKAVFSPKHQAYNRCAKKAIISVAEGAVRAGKTIDNITDFAYMLEMGIPDRIHLVTGATVGTAKLNIGDGNGFGLEYIFRGRCKWGKYRDNEALFITNKHGKKYVIIFVGGAKADSFKRIRGNSYGMWLATEVNLHHEDTIKEAFNRQLAAQVRRIYWDLNPTNPSHWIYKRYIDLFPEMFGDAYNYEHFTIFDNVTISPQRIEEIKRQYVPGSIWYRRDIEGERCIAEGLVYPRFEGALEEPYQGEVRDYAISIDYGTLNPFAALKWVQSPDGVWHCVEEYYYGGREEGDQKTDADYVSDMVRFTKDSPASDVRVIVDPSAASMIQALSRCEERDFRVWDADNSVSDGIRETNTAMELGLIRISRACTRTIEEFGGYIWNKDAEEDKPVKANDHAMDALRYFVRTMGVYEKPEEYESVLEGWRL